MYINTDEESFYNWVKTT